jgi:hypothetical protein
MQSFLKPSTARMLEDSSVRALTSRWLALALAGICLAATPAHAGVKRAGTPAVDLPASRPPDLRQSGDRAQEPDRTRPESRRKLPDPPTPVPPQPEGVCAAGSICETY